MLGDVVPGAGRWVKDGGRVGESERRTNVRVYVCVRVCVPRW